MANWEKLNKEFDSVLDNLTDEQLEAWMQQRQEKKVMRRKELELSAKIQAQKILLQNHTGRKLFSWANMETISLADLKKSSYEAGANIKTSVLAELLASKYEAGENTYAMAA